MTFEGQRDHEYSRIELQSSGTERWAEARALDTFGSRHALRVASGVGKQGSDRGTPRQLHRSIRGRPLRTCRGQRGQCSLGRAAKMGHQGASPWQGGGAVGMVEAAETGGKDRRQSGLGRMDCCRLLR